MSSQFLAVVVSLVCTGIGALFLYMFNRVNRLDERHDDRACKLQDQINNERCRLSEYVRRDELQTLLDSKK